MPAEPLRLVQTPSLLAPSEAAHTSQLSEHAAPQHRPSAQKPEVHSEATAQLAPFECFG